MSQQELLKVLGDWQSRHSDVESAVVKRRRAKCMKARWKLHTATVNRHTPIPPHFDIGWVIDISATGLGMSTQQPPATGDWCGSFIYLPEQSTPHTEHTTYCSGACRVEQTAQQRLCIWYRICGVV